MGKYFCDYCDVFLTHDSASVRRAHNAGRNHLTNVKDYYSSLGHDKAQDLIDQITKMYESGAVPNRPFPNAPTGMAGSFAGGPPPMGMSGPPGMPGMNGMNGLPGRPPFGGPQGFNPQQPGGFPGAPGGNFAPGAPLHFGQGPPPQFFNNGGPPPPMGMAPPPVGFRPPPGMPMPPPGFFGPPGGSPMASGPMSGPPPQAQNAPKLVNGYSAERAKLLGLI